ncbi:MAG: hypothetical protein KJ592_00680 [Nanoarchaeota archaeon]|nr:hypothetical protein [Nanoarchaeota archaeon]
MEKCDLIKNKLDMEYKFESQKALIFLTFGTISLLGFVIVMAIQELYDVAIIVSLIVILFATIYYDDSKNKMDKILDKIIKIKL